MRRIKPKYWENYVIKLIAEVAFNASPNRWRMGDFTDYAGATTQKAQIFA
jgi:hypothetical protein